MTLHRAFQGSHKQVELRKLHCVPQITQAASSTGQATAPTGSLTAPRGIIGQGTFRP